MATTDTNIDITPPEAQCQPISSDTELNPASSGQTVSETSTGDLCSSCMSMKEPKGQENGRSGDMESARSDSSEESVTVQDAGGVKGAQVEDGNTDAKEEEELGLNDVACDACIDSPRRALKSCLTCLVSYCGTHLRPHLENARFQSHRLVEPLQDVESRVCEGHGQPLQLYCCADGCCVCQGCLEELHKGHEVTPVEEARAMIEKELKEKQTEMERAMKAAENAIQKLHSNNATIESSVLEVRNVIRQQFAELQAAVDKAQKEVMEILDGEAQQAVNQSESIRTHLEQRCAELRKTQDQMEKLSKSKNDVDFLQDYSQWKEAEDISLPGVYIGLTDRLASFSRMVTDSTRELCERLPSVYKDKLKDTCKSDKTRIKTMVHAVVTAKYRFSLPDPKTREDFLKYAVPLSFDENSVHKYLRLTMENRKVTNTTPWQHSYPDVPERFEHWRQALTVESFYLGRHYFEVDMTGEGTYVGVTYKSIDRKGKESSSNIAGNDYSWCLQCNGTGFSAWHGDAERPLKADKFARLGVFVDFTRRRLAFYDVADSMTLLYEYKTEFLEPLYPAVWLPKKENAVVLAIPGDTLPQADPSPPPATSTELPQPNSLAPSSSSTALPQPNPLPLSTNSTLSQVHTPPIIPNSQAFPSAHPTLTDLKAPTDLKPYTAPILSAPPTKAIAKVQ
ncbi:tripartite motif-containing protein 16-like [Arapaima gigas]